MQSQTLRKSLQPVISDLQDVIDYWSEATVRGVSDHTNYLFLIKQLEQIKLFIIEAERKERDEELRLSGRTDGGLHEAKNETVADSGIEYFG